MVFLVLAPMKGKLKVEGKKSRALGKRQNKAGKARTKIKCNDIAKILRENRSKKKTSRKRKRLEQENFAKNEKRKAKTQGRASNRDKEGFL
jgi:hypothetical protein